MIDQINTLDGLLSMTTKTTYLSQFESLVEEAATQKTFSLEIIERIKKLRDTAVSLTESNENWEKDYEALSLKFDKVTETRDVLKATLETYERIEKDLTKREEEVTKKELEYRLIRQEVDSANMARHEMKELVSLVFHNPTLVQIATRQQVVPAAAPQYPGQVTYPTTIPVIERTEHTVQ